MLFGRSVFQSILTRLDSEDEESIPPVDSSAADFRVSGFNSSFVAEKATHASPAQAAGAYMDFSRADPASEEDERDDPAGNRELNRPTAQKRIPLSEPPLPVIPPYLLRLTEEQIAEDLGLSPRDTPDIAHEKRRQFAKSNHPDRVPPQFREQATIRMTTANTLVDRFLKTSQLR